MLLWRNSGDVWPVYYNVAVLTYMECFSDKWSSCFSFPFNVAVLTYMECFSDYKKNFLHDTIICRSPHLYGMLLWLYILTLKIQVLTVAVLTYMECFSDFNKLEFYLWNHGSQSSPIWNASLTFEVTPLLAGIVFVAVLTYMECFSDLILMWQIYIIIMVAVLTYMECFSDL